MPDVREMSLKPYPLPRRNDRKRTPGPFTPLEIGPVAGDQVVPPDRSVYVGGTISRRLKRGIFFKRPLDEGEVGSGHNDYS